jgi:hypothetical protein
MNGALGERLLREMSLGLSYGQNDVDVRDASRRDPDRNLPSKYDERDDGYLVDKRTGELTDSQLYAHDDLQKDTDIAYDQIFDADSAYQFASEVAGFVNVRVDAFGDHNANEHNIAQRKRQEKLLIEERKTRLVAFKDRAVELEKLRAARRQVEQVRGRLGAIYHEALKPTVDRWYWLASMTGAAAGKKVVPYWLVTDYIYNQYVQSNWRVDRFSTDVDYFEASDADHAWVMEFLNLYNSRISTLLSLTNEQIAFARSVYLTFRDSAFANLLDLKGDKRAADRLYRGLLFTIDDVTGIAQVQTEKEAVAKDAVTRDEVDPGLPASQLHFPTPADSPPEREALSTPTLTEAFLAMVSAAFPTKADDIAAEVSDGLKLALSELITGQFKMGLAAPGFVGLLELMKATLFSTELASPGDLAFHQLLRPTAALTATFGQLTIVYTSFGKALLPVPFKNALRSVLLGDTTTHSVDCTVALDAKEKRLEFVVKSNGHKVFTVTVEHLDTTLPARALRAFEEFGHRAKFAIAADDRYQTQYARFFLSIFFWNTVMPLPNVREALLTDFDTTVRSPSYLALSNNYAAVRKNFDDLVPFRMLMRPNEPTLPQPPNPGNGFQRLASLRHDFNIAAHFVRELFRATFVTKYDREKIDAQLRLPKDAIIADAEKEFTFVDDVRFSVDEINVIRPASERPPEPGLTPALLNVIGPLVARPPPPLRLNDPVFFKTWEKLYANLFFRNDNEKDADVADRLPYWRPLFRKLVESNSKTRGATDAAIPRLWEALTAQEVAPRYLTLRQRGAGGTISGLTNLDLKLTNGMDEPDNPAALEFEARFRNSAFQMGDALAKTPAQPLTLLLQAMLTFVDDYYPNILTKVDESIANLAETQEKAVKVLQSVLTNDSTLALDELKRIAADTYLPDPRFHMQAKFMGRFKFSALFLTAVRAAYSDLQSLARTSTQLREANNYGRRPRPLPYDYSPLEGVPMDVLTCNTDSDGGKRDYIDLATTDQAIFTQLRNCMAAMVAQHMFSIRLDAPDEYKSVVQHQRSPQQLKAAQQAMTQFAFERTGGRAWRVTLT